MRPGRPILLLVLGLAGCAGTPPPADPANVLDRAATAVDEGNPGRAVTLLDELVDEDFPHPMRPRFRVLLAHARLAAGRPHEAFEGLVDFADLYPLSDERRVVQELLYRIGAALARGDDGFLFFPGDRSASRRVLEHLVVRYPGSPHHDDALRILGDIAFEDMEWERADRRYREIVRDWRDSEWVDYALYRLAMTRFRRLQGPAYDLAAMQAARSELLGLLEDPPENPRFVREARAALEVVTTWIARRHLIVADYYRCLGNDLGERRNLERAAREEFAPTPAGREARRRLAALPAADEEGT